jgi:hypothetical protein
LLKHGMAKNSLLILHTNAELAAYSEARGRDAKRLLDKVRTAARKLKSMPSSLSVITRLGFEAQLAAIDGKPELALAIVQRLRVHPVCRQNQGSQYVFNYFEGQLQRGAAGLAKQREALAFFAAQGWKRPARAIAIVWPALEFHAL